MLLFQSDFLYLLLCNQLGGLDSVNALPFYLSDAQLALHKAVLIAARHTVKLDVQKLFSLAYDDGKNRCSLEAAVDFLEIENNMMKPPVYLRFYQPAELTFWLPVFIQPHSSDFNNFKIGHLPLDLSELQSNMQYYGMATLQDAPLRFLDVQKPQSFLLICLQRRLPCFILCQRILHVNGKNLFIAQTIYLCLHGIEKGVKSLLMLHHVAKKLLHVKMEELQSGKPFVEVMADFIAWCVQKPHEPHPLLSLAG